MKQSKKPAQKHQPQQNWGIIMPYTIGLVGLVIVAISAPVWYLHNHVATTEHTEVTKPCEKEIVVEKVYVSAPKEPTIRHAGHHKLLDPELEEVHMDCPGDGPDHVWCNIPMPTESFFGFDPPNDPLEWHRAQVLAARGGHVLLRRVMESFPHPNDFLDGDIAFRQLHKTIDVFIDKENYFEPLAHPPNAAQQRGIDREFRGANKSQALKYGFKQVDERVQPWMLQEYTYVPDPYDWKTAGRVPIVQIGYTVFERDHNKYFSGNELGGLYFGRQHFLERWKKICDRLKTPIILVAGLNENWGFLSSTFPNRTAEWGALKKSTEKEVYEFLDHPNLLMLVGSQHSNISHPKILTLPRGIPLTWSNTHKIIWDTMRTTSGIVNAGSGRVDKPKLGGKDKLLFAASSKYGYRPRILKCISGKFTPDDFEGHINTPRRTKRQAKTDRPTYYAKLATSRIGLSLPGLGYDCYRTWEILTMGVVLVVERGVGLDRTFWRLPVIKLSDFSEMTPQLLRQAYVEAMYRRDDFEFERLHMSYWLQILTDVSASRSIDTMMARFPMEAEDSAHTRPLEYYDCGEKGEKCGPGTRRPPREMC